MGRTKTNISLWKCEIGSIALQKANERMFSFSSVCGAEHKSLANIWITKWEWKEEISLNSHR
jgi:hypothetical protein